MGNTLIVFASNYGTVEKCARLLFQHLNGNVDICNLGRRDTLPNLSNYDTVIIGGSIHFGEIQKNVEQFCFDHLDELCQKNIGLFINCLYSGDKAMIQLMNAFPDELHDRAIVADYFGGEILDGKLSYWEKVATAIIVKSGIAGDLAISGDKIRHFTHKINSAKENGKI